MENDNHSVKQNKRCLFWSVYVTEKALSLRLGRASSIQDYDISVPTTIELHGGLEPWRTIYPLWINLARIQGKVYEMLYSPTALRKPANERASYARQLAAEMQTNVEEPIKVCFPTWTTLLCCIGTRLKLGRRPARNSRTSLHLTRFTSSRMKSAACLC